MNKFTYRAIWIVIILAFGGILQLAYWQFYPYNLLEFHAPFTTSKLVYEPGEILATHTNVTHNTNGIKVSVVKQMQDGYLINFPETQYVTTKGKIEFVNTTIKIPDFAQKGKYRLIVNSVFHINPIRDITIKRVSNEFEVK